tara:strand:- start:11092 stop:11367 length:276 start_codon:yes stop_codon:yes gene_type:complete
MGKGLFEFIFRDKPARVIMALLDIKTPVYASVLAKEVDCTFPHIVKILKELKEHKLIKILSDGRTKPIVLLPAGKKIAISLRTAQAACKEK